MLAIRDELPADAVAVRAINTAAFGRAAEAGLVEALRAAGRVTLSLVAVDDGGPVGHLLLSPARVVGDKGRFAALALGPMAVRPDRQRRGVGSRLVAESLARAAEAGHAAVFVLGHPEFYPRLGFRLADERGIACEFSAPPEAFMVAELREGVLRGVAGTLRYAPEFHAL